MRASIQHYRENMQALGYRKEYIRAATRHVERLVLWGEREGIASWEDWKPSYVGLALAPWVSLAKPGHTTVYHAFTHARSFFRYLLQSEERHVFPAGAIRLPQKSQPQPRSRSVEECQRIINAPDVGKMDGQRDRLIMALAYYAGLRCGEIVNLDVGDVDIPERVIRIREGKHYRDTEVIIFDELLPYLQDWLLMGRLAYPRHKQSRLLILSRNRDGYSQWLPRRKSQLTTNAVRSMVRKYAAQVGIQDFSIHQLRHSLATHLLKGGVDVFKVRRILRHKYIATTMHYASRALPTAEDAWSMAQRVMSELQEQEVS